MRLETFLEYDSALATRSVRSELAGLYRYRDFVKQLVVRSLKSRYKRSLLGVAWSLLNPLVNMVILTVVFSTLFRMTIPRYPIYVLVGLLVWNLFSQSTADSANQLVWGGGLLRTVYLPPSVFAVASVAGGVVNFLLTLIPLIAIMVALEQPFYEAWWFVPVAIAIVAMFCVGQALLVSTAAIFFNDVVYMYQLLLQAWFFATPILYPREIIPAEYAWAVEINPMFSMVEIVRRPIFQGEVPDVGSMIIAAAWASSTLGAGLWVFCRRAGAIATRV